jgi:drug/metabolite transporter (DMT)-like permease
MRFAAYVALVAALLLWSGNWVVGRAVREDISPGIATLGRILIVVAALAPFALPGLKARLKALGAQEWRPLVLAGVFGGGIHLAMQWLGLRYTTATSAILFISTSPIFILILAQLFLKEGIGTAQWTGVGVSFAGVAMIASGGDPAALSRLELNAGDLLALGSMLMWAAYTVTIRRRRDRLDNPQFLLVVCAVGMLSVLPWVAWELAHDPRAALSRTGVAAFVYSGLGSFLLAYLAWTYAVMRLGAARAGAWMHLMPAFGVLLAALFLDEYPRWHHFAGIALILAGIALSSLRAASAASSR